MIINVDSKEDLKKYLKMQIALCVDRIDSIGHLQGLLTYLRVRYSDWIEEE